MRLNRKRAEGCQVKKWVVCPCISRAVQDLGRSVLTSGQHCWCVNSSATTCMSARTWEASSSFPLCLHHQRHHTWQANTHLPCAPPACSTSLGDSGSRNFTCKFAGLLLAVQVCKVKTKAQGAGKGLPAPLSSVLFLLLCF